MAQFSHTLERGGASVVYLRHGKNGFFSKDGSRRGGAWQQHRATRGPARVGPDNAGVDVPPEFAHLRFLNQVAAFETSLEVHDFARRMHGIEDAQGRVRTGVRNAPRTIDLDLIAFGDLVLDEPDLTLPHPRARARAFVTGPLAEILPDFKWP